MTLDVQVLQHEQLGAALHTLERAFGSAPHPDDAAAELSVVDDGRFYGVFDGSSIVATAGSFDFRMTIPGAPLPVAGVTWVGVLPTYRRRGLLNAMMSRQLHDLHDGGTAVAALWASESAIYGRYGYGAAAWRLALEAASRAPFSLPVESGGLRMVDPDEPQLRAVYAEVAARTSGWPERDDRWWAYRLHDPEHARHGGSPLQCVLTDGGYALYSTAGRWDNGLPTGVVRVREVVAGTPAASARIWRHLLDLDLMRTVEVPGVAPDDWLVMTLLAEPRVARSRLSDCLHVRLVDVPTALAARRYAADVDFVLEVRDVHCPWNVGRWRLVGGRSDASCAAVSAEPDLVLDVSDLGAAYLGGTPLRSRVVEERTSGALAAATTAFGPLEGAPWCPQVF